MLTQQQLHQLAQQLPQLTFIRGEDDKWAKDKIAQAYVDFYQINFSRDCADLVHGFGTVEAAGFRIATHYWLPVQARGTLVISHGLYDHSGIYKHAIRFALEQNLAVLIFDLPGHGLSSGKPTEIDSFDQYADVLAIILQKSRALLPQPLYSLSQSTGGAMVLNYLWRYAWSDPANPNFEKIACCAPLVLARKWSLGKYLYFILRPCLKHIKRGIAQNSHDQAFIDFITTQDPLQAKLLPLKWVGAMKTWHRQFCQFAPHHQEILVVQGTGDMTVAWRYNLPLLTSKLPNAKITMLADARHQLVNESEPYRRQVFSTIKNYFNL